MIFESTRDRELAVEFNWLFLEGKTWKWVDQEVGELTINCFFDIFLEDFILVFILLFHCVFYVPWWSKNTVFSRGWLFNCFWYFFVLKVEGLNWSSDIVVGSDSFLHVFSVVFVNSFHFIGLFVKASWWKVESENGFCFLEHNGDISLEILDSESFRIFFRLCMFLFFRLALWICLGFTTRHEIRSLLEIGAASFHFRIILCSGGKYMRIEGTLNFHFDLFSCFFITLLSIFQKFQILFSVFPVPLSDQSIINIILTP